VRFPIKPEAAMWRALTLLAALCITGMPGQVRAADTLLTLTPRPGTELRVVVDRPAMPTGSVILLAGGSGVLDIDAQGRINQLAGNHLIRTRTAYVRAGYAVFVPDIASDLKGTQRYRFSATHANDLALVVAAARRTALPVWVIGTSRGAVSAANLFTHQAAPLPDGLVISSGTLMNYNLPGAVGTGDIGRIKVPVLLLRHRDDSCRVTPPADADRFKALLVGAPKVDIVTLTGGGPASARADPCEANHYHGFFGIDDQAVAATLDWMRATARR
jgi:dienelactone hydrolase